MIRSTSTGKGGRDVNDIQNHPADLARVAKVVRLPFSALAAGVELALTRRGFCAAFMALAGVLALSGGLRPPVHGDLKSVHLPIGALKAEDFSSATLLSSSGEVTLASPGMILLAMIGAAMVIVTLRPAVLGAVAGILLAASIGFGADICLNHPALVELMDSEYRQRRQVAVVLKDLEENVLVRDINGRITDAPGDGSGGELLLRGWTYLVRWHWLILLAGMGVLLGHGGTFSKRFRYLALWVFLGAALAGLLCVQRLRAEYYWFQVECLELRGDFSSARQALDRAIGIFPELDQLQRTWLLAGKLDFYQKRSTSREQFFRAHQLSNDQMLAQAVALMDMVVEKNHTQAVRNQAGRIFTLTGMDHYRHGRLCAAEDMWQRAQVVNPTRFDCRFFLGTVQRLMDPSRPELVEAKFQKIFSRLADRVLRADILSSLGDAYFEAGRMTEARQWYRKSRSAFGLPKNINYRAEKGLTGI